MPEELPTLPMTCAWTWFAHKAAGAPQEGTYADRLLVLGHMDTLNCFCRHWNHIPKDSIFQSFGLKVAGVPVNGFSFFQQGVRPEWEDPRCRAGGEFVFRVHDAAELDAAWRDLLFGCAAGHAPLVGCRLVQKTPVKLEAWYDGDVSTQTVRDWLEAEVIGKRLTVRLASHKLHATMT